MESKEALENIMEFMQDLEDNPILSIPAFTMYSKELKTIHKDLEILEILKKFSWRFYEYSYDDTLLNEEHFKGGYIRLDYVKLNEEGFNLMRDFFERNRKTKK